MNIVGAQFEDVFPAIDNPVANGFPRSRHLDFAFRYKDGGRVGVECKLSEPYRWLNHAPLAPHYLALADAWADIPACQALAEQLTAGSAGYNRLGPSQLLKHILGLKFRTPVENVRLVYL